MTAPYVASGPEDLIALVPTVLRYEPREAVVVMTFGPQGCPFHACVELPKRPREQDAVAETVLKAIRNNHLRECAVIVYSQEHPAGAAQGRKLNRKLRRAGIRVVDVLLVDGPRYYRVLAGDTAGTLLDVSSHPFTLRRAADGVVVHASRAELAQTLAPDPRWAARGPEIVRLARQWLQEGARQQGGEGYGTAEAHWLARAIGEALATGVFEDAIVPRLLADLLDPDMVDVAWAGIEPGNAEAQAELWRDLVRRAPADLVDAPACLLAFAAWLAGDGALAWCGLDRCGSTSLTMASMLECLLHHAVSPALWPRMSAAELTALRRQAA